MKEKWLLLLLTAWAEMKPTNSEKGIEDLFGCLVLSPKLAAQLLLLSPLFLANLETVN